MSNPTTNFLIKNVYGVYQDLSGIFLPYKYGTGTGAADTGYKVNGNDLSTIFAGISSTNIGYDTGYKSKQTGLDLRYVFAPYTISVPFTVENTNNYTYLYSNNYYVIVFTNNNTTTATNVTNTITFTESITTANVAVVGGGGAGGNSYNQYSSEGYMNGGGGGQGGYVNSYTNISLNATSYNIQVGYGGIGNTSKKGGSGGTSFFSSYSSSGGIGGDGFIKAVLGGNGLGGGTRGNFGSGGNGAYSVYGTIQNNSTSGIAGTTITINESNYTFGGGGAGGSNSNTTTSSNHSNGGLGGGGGDCTINGLSNNGNAYVGVDGNTYASNYNSGVGFPNTGGGGAGANAKSTGSTYVKGYNGGSGIVIIWFEWP